MAPRLSSEPRSTSSWLRREDAPSVIDSMESSASIWSMRILADSAISASVASAASNAMSSGRGAPAGAAARAPRAGAARLGRRSAAASGAAAPASSSSSWSGSGSVSVANSTAASRSELSTSVVLCEYSGSLSVLVARPGDGRRGLHADLDEPLDAETARGLLDEQQVLGLDPAHRAGELPGQQLDDDLAAQLARLLVAPGVVVGEDLVERLGGHQVADLLDEVAVQGERPRHQVRDVACRRSGPDPRRAA